MKEENNRFYPRIFFSAKADLKAAIVICGRPDDSISVHILNLSEGGIGFAVQKDKAAKINIGEHLILKKISGDVNWEFLSESKLEIKWISDYDCLNNMAFGCEFIDPPQSVRDGIRQQITLFVDQNKQKNNESP